MPSTAIRVPRRPSLGGYSISLQAIVEAAAELGLSQPIAIKWSQGRRTLGAHRFHVGQGHSITVTTYHAHEARISETIWHELCHARQTEKAIAEVGGNERAGRIMFMRAYKAQSRAVGYRNNIFEVEARAMGAAYCDTKPLTKGARQALAPVAPQPPVSTPEPVQGSMVAVGTGHAVAVERKSRVTGHVVRVIDARVAEGYTEAGGRWVVVDTTTGQHQRFAGKRAAKAAMSTFGA